MSATSSIVREFKLPPRFWADHFERCGAHPGFRDVVKETKRYVVVRLDREALADLRGDAELYASNAAPDWSDGGGIRASARATLRALTARGHQ